MCENKRGNASQKRIRWRSDSHFGVYIGLTAAVPLGFLSGGVVGEQVPRVRHRMEALPGSAGCSPSGSDGGKGRRGTSAFRGVSWIKTMGRWVAGIGCKGEKHYLGAYRSEEEAARAYDAAAIRLLGPAAIVNFPAGELASHRSLDNDRNGSRGKARNEDSQYVSARRDGTTAALDSLVDVALGFEGEGHPYVGAVVGGEGSSSGSRCFGKGLDVNKKNARDRGECEDEELGRGEEFGGVAFDGVALSGLGGEPSADHPSHLDALLLLGCSAYRRCPVTLELRVVDEGVTVTLNVASCGAGSDDGRLVALRVEERCPVVAVKLRVVEDELGLFRLPESTEYCEDTEESDTSEAMDEDTADGNTPPAWGRSFMDDYRDVGLPGGVTCGRAALYGVSRRVSFQLPAPSIHQAARACLPAPS